MKSACWTSHAGPVVHGKTWFLVALVLVVAAVSLCEPLQNCPWEVMVLLTTFTRIESWWMEMRTLQGLNLPLSLESPIETKFLHNSRINTSWPSLRKKVWNCPVAAELFIMRVVLESSWEAEALHGKFLALTAVVCFGGAGCVSRHVRG
mmetsp:Transcript_91106/g.175385  ORF Transcript_91106/g.175385 Transcript_91106/m.175385 type:complete len:149 (-) Transcript_91106:474-920(-)